MPSICFINVAVKQLTNEWKSLSENISHTLSNFKDLEISTPVLDSLPISELP